MTWDRRTDGDRRRMQIGLDNTLLWGVRLAADEYNHDDGEVRHLAVAGVGCGAS